MVNTGTAFGNGALNVFQYDTKLLNCRRNLPRLRASMLVEMTDGANESTFDGGMRYLRIGSRLRP